MPLPLVGGTIWTEMGPQEEARVMKTYHVERTKNWTSLHSNWLMYISHCYKQLGTTAPGRNQQLGQRNDLACLCQQLGSCPNPGICQERWGLSAKMGQLPGPTGRRRPPKTSPTTQSSVVLHLARDSPPLPWMFTEVTSLHFTHNCTRLPHFTSGKDVESRSKMQVDSYLGWPLQHGLMPVEP
ncbi:dexamethasone-induced protein isoform X1 [Meriones unguiculatus]|uniref:dexamethasone-induced protein isoform X1 n=1 Tax=Meriones unguiculatus TaxID=10047 RepID=UPI00293E6A1F|nr:dexamethasone-induced protein isoform X1 [Meriones unguiculatus]